MPEVSGNSAFPSQEDRNVNQAADPGSWKNGVGDPTLAIWGHFLGGQHPSPNVKKKPLPLRAEFWLEIITSRDAKSACFEGSRTSCL